MGTTAEKLSYLNGTKRLLRRRLNSLGASITLETTFRNYLVWLNEFYRAAAASINIEILGATTQESGQLVNKTGTITYTTTDGENYQVHLKSTNIFDKNNVHWYRNNGREFSNITNTSSNYMRTDAFSIKGTNREFYIYDLPENVSLNSVIPFQDTSGNTTTYSISGNKISVNWNTYYMSLIVSGNDFTDDTVQQIENANIVLREERYAEAENYYDIKLCSVTTHQDKIFSRDDKFYLLKETGYIESYNGEALPGDYITSTGVLENGVEVVYALDTPVLSEIKMENDGFTYNRLYSELSDILEHEVIKIIKEKITGGD